jgi:hypothetical protein
MHPTKKTFHGEQIERKHRGHTVFAIASHSSARAGVRLILSRELGQFLASSQEDVLFSPVAPSSVGI